MSKLLELEKKAIDRLKMFEPSDENGYYLAYSGDKYSLKI